MTYIYLAAAIICEVIATSALKMSAEFSRPVPTAVMVCGYLAAFYLMALTLRTLPIGITYAIWSGTGIVLITLVGALSFRQVPDLAAIIGIGLIFAGVLTIHLFSSNIQ